MSVARPVVSIVTPVHNGADLISECLDSVLRQTETSWHLVVIDNASTDGTSDVVAAYAARDSRISLARHDVLVDAWENHNRALRAADPSSVWIKIVQADDRLFPRCLEKMCSLGDSSPSIGFVSSYRVKGDAIELRGLPPGVEVVDGRTMLRQSLVGGPYLTGSPIVAGP
jgi:glycosyltransferase involved in cell wall biosynthesis